MTSSIYHDVLIFKDQRESPYILLTDDNNLTSFETAPHFWQTCEPVNRAISDLFDIEVITARCLRANFTDERRHYTYHLVYRNGHPKQGKWVAVTDVQGAIKDLATEALRSQANAPEWYAPDGYQTIIDAFPNATIEQVRSWERSAVWRIRHNQQTQYLKVIPTMFRYERLLTQWIATQFPHLTPMPELLFDNAMLTPEYHGTMLDHTVSQMASMLSSYADMQVQTIDKLDDLTIIGVPRRDMDWVALTADQLFADESALRIGSNPLNDEEIHLLRSLYPCLKSHIDKLRGFEALEHGDLHHGQVFVDALQQITITDFSDATITHPFFSLVYFLWDVKDTVVDQTTVHAYLTSIYLKPFKDGIDDTTCQIMMESAKLVSPLYSAVRYYADILPQMAYPWEMNNMLAFNLRILLDTARNLDLI